MTELHARLALVDFIMIPPLQHAPRALLIVINAQIKQHATHVQLAILLQLVINAQKQINIMILQLQSAFNAQLVAPNVLIQQHVHLALISFI